MKRDCKGIWIPIETWEMKELSFLEKGLLSEIHSLDCSEEHCFASNNYFASFFNCGTATITRAIQHLIELNFVQLLHYDGKKRVLKTGDEFVQILSPSNHYPNQNDQTLSSKRLDPSNQNDQHNNIYINNKTNTYREFVFDETKDKNEDVIQLDELFKIYPARQGANNIKMARMIFLERLCGGFTVDQIKNSFIAYKKHCDAFGITGTRFVKQISSFLSDTENITREWETKKKEVEKDNSAEEHYDPSKDPYSWVK